MASLFSCSFLLLFSSCFFFFLVRQASCSSTFSSISSSSAAAASFLPDTTPAIADPSQTLLINLILLTNHARLPASATIFLPLNQSIAFAFPSLHTLDTVSYHIASPRLPFRDLLLHPPTAGLPSLLPDRSIRIHSSSPGSDRVSVDQQTIVAPDLYFDEHLVIHGISRALNPDFYMFPSSSAVRTSPFPGAKLIK